MGVVVASPTHHDRKLKSEKEKTLLFVVAESPVVIHAREELVICFLPRTFLCAACAVLLFAACAVLRNRLHGRVVKLVQLLVSRLGQSEVLCFF